MKVPRGYVADQRILIADFAVSLIKQATNHSGNGAFSRSRFADKSQAFALSQGKGHVRNRRRGLSECFFQAFNTQERLRLRFCRARDGIRREFPHQFMHSGRFSR